MKEGVQSAFAEMLDISTDIDKAVLFDQGGVLASNMSEEAQAVAVAQAVELTRLGEARAGEMGSQPFTQLVVEAPGGYVFLTREPVADGMTAIATGRSGSRVGLVLYDLRTCIRDAREAKGGEAVAGQPKEEA